MTRLIRALIFILFASLTASVAGAQPQFGIEQTPIAVGQLSSTACPGNGCVILNANGLGDIGIEVSGTFVGTINFEQALDGVAYGPVVLTRFSDSTTSNFTTTPGYFSAFTGGRGLVRARMSAYLSGAATVIVQNKTNSTQVFANVVVSGTCTGCGGSGIVLPVSVANGGTGRATLTSQGVLVGAGTSTVVSTTAGTAGQLLQSGGTLSPPSWLTTVPVANGGTGANTLTAHGVLVGEGTSSVAVTSAGTAGQILTSNGASADPTFQTVVGTGSVTSVATTAPLAGGTITTTGTITCATCVTAASALSANGVVIGAGLQAAAVTAVGTAGQVLTSNGAGMAPTFQSTGAGLGDVSSNTATSVVNEIALFADTTGKLIKRSTGTGLAGLTSGVLGAVTTSAGVAGNISDETGTGPMVFGTSPTLVTPTLGVATATTVNKLTITAPATGSTLTIPDGVTLTGPSASGTVATLGNTNTFTGRQDASGAASTSPIKVGTSLPVTCVIGDVYFKSDATAGRNIYQCTSTNTWTQEQGSGSGGDFSSNTSTSVVGELVTFADTSGKLGKRSTGTGLLTYNSGVASAVTTSAAVSTLITDGTGSGAMVFGTSPTIVTPTIASFTNATHNHSNAAGGGNITGAAFASQTANTFLAAPDGASGTMVNRAIVAADIPTSITETAISGGTTIATYGGSYVADCATACTINLPTVTGHAGDSLAFRIASTSALVTLDGSGSQTLCNNSCATTRIMWAGESALLLIDRAGTYWQKVSGVSIPMTAHLRRGTNQTGLTNATWTPIVMTSQTSGTSLLYDSVNGRITIVRPGTYNISGGAQADNLTSASTSYIYLAISKNGAGNVQGGKTQFKEISGSALGSYAFQAATAVVGDYMSMDVYPVSGATATATGDLYLSITEVPTW